MGIIKREKDQPKKCDRTYCVTDNISPSTSRDIIKIIATANMEDATIAPEERSPIHIFINCCNGGDVYPTFAIIDAIVASMTPVYTYALGCVQSSAFLLFLAGEKRYAGENIMFMYHQIQVINSNYVDIERAENMMCENMDVQDIIEEYVHNRAMFKKSELHDIKSKKTMYYIRYEEALRREIITDDLEFSTLGEVR